MTAVNCCAHCDYAERHKETREPVCIKRRLMPMAPWEAWLADPFAENPCPIFYALPDAEIERRARVRQNRNGTT